MALTEENLGYLMGWKPQNHEMLELEGIREHPIQFLIFQVSD